MRIEEKIGVLLRDKGHTLSVAESCTGGRISHLLTTVSGSSSYYLGSVTSYAVSVKEAVLGVPEEIIRSQGVVSAAVAAAMAEGVRRLTGSTFSVATTGLAEGGDERYPEGSVWIAASGPRGTKTLFFRSEGGRRANIRNFARAALCFLFEHIKEEESIDNKNIKQKSYT